MNEPRKEGSHIKDWRRDWDGFLSLHWEIWFLFKPSLHIFLESSPVVKYSRASMFLLDGLASWIKSIGLDLDPPLRSNFTLPSSSLLPPFLLFLPDLISSDLSISPTHHFLISPPPFFLLISSNFLSIALIFPSTPPSGFFEFLSRDNVVGLKWSSLLRWAPEEEDVEEEGWYWDWEGWGGIEMRSALRSKAMIVVNELESWDWVENSRA